MSVSVPEELKQRMEGYRVNWSAVACEAFEQRLMYYENDLDEVIGRLRRSKIENTTEAYEEGRNEGKLWAETTADFSDLKALGRAVRTEYGLSIFEVKQKRTQTMAEIIYLALKRKEDAGDANEFWTAEVKAENFHNLEDDWFLGFVEGAHDVWDAVYDQI